MAIGAFGLGFQGAQQHQERQQLQAQQEEQAGRERLQDSFRMHAAQQQVNAEMWAKQADALAQERRIKAEQQTQEKTLAAGLQRATMAEQGDTLRTMLTQEMENVRKHWDIQADWGKAQMTDRRERELKGLEEKVKLHIAGQKDQTELQKQSMQDATEKWKAILQSADSAANNYATVEKSADPRFTQAIHDSRRLALMGDRQGAAEIMAYVEQHTTPAEVERERDWWKKNFDMQMEERTQNREDQKFVLEGKKYLTEKAAKAASTFQGMEQVKQAWTRQQFEQRKDPNYISGIQKFLVDNDQRFKGWNPDKVPIPDVQKFLNEQDQVRQSYISLVGDRMAGKVDENTFQYKGAQLMMGMAPDTVQSLQDYSTIQALQNNASKELLGMAGGELPVVSQQSFDKLLQAMHKEANGTEAPPGPGANFLSESGPGKWISSMLFADTAQGNPLTNEKGASQNQLNLYLRKKFNGNQSKINEEFNRITASPLGAEGYIIQHKDEFQKALGEGQTNLPDPDPWFVPKVAAASFVAEGAGMLAAKYMVNPILKKVASTPWGQKNLPTLTSRYAQAAAAPAGSTVGSYPGRSVGAPEMAPTPGFTPGGFPSSGGGVGYEASQLGRSGFSPVTPKTGAYPTPTPSFLNNVGVPNTEIPNAPPFLKGVGVPNTEVPPTMSAGGRDWALSPSNPANPRTVSVDPNFLGPRPVPSTEMGPQPYQPNFQIVQPQQAPTSGVYSQSFEPGLLNSPAPAPMALPGAPIPRGLPAPGQTNPGVGPQTFVGSPSAPPGMGLPTNRSFGLPEQVPAGATTGGQGVPGQVYDPVLQIVHRATNNQTVTAAEGKAAFDSIVQNPGILQQIPEFNAEVQNGLALGKTPEQAQEAAANMVGQKILASAAASKPSGTALTNGITKVGRDYVAPDGLYKSRSLSRVQEYTRKLNEMSAPRGKVGEME